MKYRKYLLYAAAAFLLLIIPLLMIPGFRFSILLSIGCAGLCILFWLLTKSPTAPRKKLCKILLIFLLIGCMAAGITLGFVVSAANPSEGLPCRYIIVLGAKVNGTAPSLTLRERINAAYDYLSGNPEAIAVLSGGQGPDEGMTEAACMQRELLQMGIPASRLLLEEKSTSTMENLRFSLDILEAETGSRPGRVGIISSEYHMFRAIRFGRELGLDVVGVPAKTTWVPLRVNYYLREIVAVWKYLILGP